MHNLWLLCAILSPARLICFCIAGKIAFDATPRQRKAKSKLFFQLSEKLSRDRSNLACSTGKTNVAGLGGRRSERGALCNPVSGVGGYAGVLSWSAANHGVGVAGQIVAHLVL